MEKKAKRGRCGTWNLNYHLVWTPKRRAPVLKGLIATDLKDLISQKATELGLEIKAIEAMPDHVHLFVSSIPQLSPHRIVKAFKGLTSNVLRKKYPQLLKLPSLWSSSYYCGSVGEVSESVVKAYIEAQKKS